MRSCFHHLPSEHRILVHAPILPSSPQVHVLQSSCGEGTRDPGMQPIVTKTNEMLTTHRIEAENQYKTRFRI